MTFHYIFLDSISTNLKKCIFNSSFLVFQIVTAAPQKFKIDIMPVDDGTPRIVTNLGLQWLEYMENKVQVGLRVLSLYERMPSS